MKVRTSLAMLTIAALAFSAFGNLGGVPMLPLARASGYPCTYAPPGTAPVVYITNSTGTGPHEAAASMGSSHTFNVCAGNISLFDSWDIQVQVDPTILNSVSISLTGSTLPAPNVVLECINGILVVGTACAASDGVGIIHSSVVSLSGSAVGGGPLFSISYSQVASGGFSTVHIFNEVIVDRGASIVHVTYDGTFGSSLVIPELPFGTILSLLLPLAALIIYAKVRTLTIK